MDTSQRHPRFAVVMAFGVLVSARVFGAADALDPRLDAAVTLYRLEGAEKALPAFEQLARELSSGVRPRDQAAALHYVGECHWRLGQFRDAREYLDRALALERASGDRSGEGKTLNVIGLLDWDQGNYDQAIERFRRAGVVARTIEDSKLEGASLNNLSLVFDELGDYDTSLEQYQTVLELYRGADFPRGVGDTLGNIGGVHLLLGHFREALGYYSQALQISEQLKSKTSMSQDHGNIALCLLGLGDIDKALLHLDRAIGLTTQTGMRQDEAYWTREKGNGLIQQGRYDLGLEHHRAALAIYEDVGAQAELLEALHDIGRLHLLLGDTESAERYFTRALQVAREIGFSRGITLNLISLGDLQLHRERLEAAASLYEQARQRSVESGQQHVLAQSLLRLAVVHRKQQRPAPADQETTQALAISRKIGARDLKGEALLSQAELERGRGQLAEALRSFAAAEAALAPIGDPDLLWQIHLGRARTAEARGDVGAAIKSLQSAVSLIEGVRSRLQEPRFRAGYVEDKFEVYRELMRLQLQQGRTADAFSTAERLRARSYVEQLGGRSASPLSDDARQKETQLRERIRQLQSTLTDEDREGQPAHPQRAMNRFSQELMLAQQEYQAFLDDHAGTQAVVAAANAVPDASSIQRRLADDEALLEYVVGPDHVVAFVITARGITATSMPVREADLGARVALLRDLVRRPGDNRWIKPAARLSAELFDPVERSGSLRGAHRLYIVPHGALNFVSFALLPMRGDERPGLLIDRYTVAYLPAAAALLRDATPGGVRQSLLSVSPARARLRFAPEEARSVGTLFGPRARLLLGADATESRFKRLAGHFQVLHLATHGYFDKVNPLLSGLELEADGANDGLLQVHEVLGLHLHANLVTLSACDTAMGAGYFAELPTGDEFVGMTRAFLSAGSAAVLASLWQVDDRASVTLMQEFYGRLNQPGRDSEAANALAHVQRQLHRSTELGHPYYWAAYVLVGAMSRKSGHGQQSVGRTS